jgi:RNA polymerase sigma-70 factor (ECF subfamily)
MTEPPQPAGGGEAAPPLETTFDLLARARGGDDRARERLLARMLPPLRAWAHQRLPHRARDLAETDDLVQVTLVRVLRHLDGFEHRGEGALLAYLRQILLNAVRDEVRRTARREPREELRDAHPDPTPSPLERLVGRETLERYEAALQRLGSEQREAVILKVEMGYSNAEIAEALGRPSTDAARVFTARAIAQLAEAMREQP